MKKLEIEALLTQPSESLMRVLLDMSPAAASIAIDGKVIYANDACARLWAYRSAADMLGLSFFELITPESQAIVIELWRKRPEGTDPWTYELTGLRDNGTAFDYRCTSVSLETMRGKATFAFFEEIDSEGDFSFPTE